MVKSIISAILGVLILIGASIVENMVVEKSFNSFNDRLVTLQQKIKNETANGATAQAVKQSLKPLVMTTMQYKQL